MDALLAKLKETVAKPLEGLRVVPYYGCLAVRPVDVVEPEDPENPMQMDHILEAMGAEVLSWPYKTDCCGGSLALTRTDLVLKLSRKLLDMAATVEADVMVTMCPMCQANLDTRQADISRETGVVYHIPVMYLTELMGVALQQPPAQALVRQAYGVSGSGSGTKRLDLIFFSETPFHEIPGRSPGIFCFRPGNQISRNVRKLRREALR